MRPASIWRPAATSGLSPAFPGSRRIRRTSFEARDYGAGLSFLARLSEPTDTPRLHVKAGDAHLRWPRVLQPSPPSQRRSAGKPPKRRKAACLTPAAPSTRPTPAQLFRGLLLESRGARARHALEAADREGALFHVKHPLPRKTARQDGRRGGCHAPAGHRARHAPKHAASGGCALLDRSLAPRPLRPSPLAAPAVRAPRPPPGARRPPTSAAPRAPGRGPRRVRRATARGARRAARPRRRSLRRARATLPRKARRPPPGSTPGRARPPGPPAPPRPGLRPPPGRWRRP